MNIETIIDKLGITPNAMQQDAFNAILHSNKDVVVLSPTGSGKTLAYLLPWFNAWMLRSTGCKPLL